MQTHVLGFPRMGASRELKFALERHWRGELSAQGLVDIGRELTVRHWEIQREAGLSLVAVGDFSFYDHVLDTAAMLGLLPGRFADEPRPLFPETYFAMARGDAEKNLPPLDMTKWFDTNYHYLAPEITPGMTPRLARQAVIEDARLAVSLGHRPKAVLLGPLTFLSLCRAEDGADRFELLPGIMAVYREILQQLAPLCPVIQIDEPILCTEMATAAKAYFKPASVMLRAAAEGAKLLLATYFGGLGENLDLALESGFDILHLDATRAGHELSGVADRLLGDMSLSLGLVSGRNIWKTDLARAVATARDMARKLGEDRLLIGTGCSLLHCPVDLERERALAPDVRRTMSFAVQKCREVAVIAEAAEGWDHAETLAKNAADLAAGRDNPLACDPAVRRRLEGVTPAMLSRQSPFAERKKAQQARLNLPLLPTTTIGSFPQTAAIRAARLALRRGEMDQAGYRAAMQEAIADAVARQEALSLDVLVHGEPERNDMVEYFGQMLGGFCFTENGWVQSYGSRCVKPPVIFGDVSRPAPMTVDWIGHAQSLTQKPVKGMLTGPVTILNWSFVREDIPRAEVCRQIALAVRDEVADLERAGTPIIQIDEAAFREGLPLGRADQEAYLTWAVECFRLTASGVSDATQIHTHMCYSEFGTIIRWIAAMDADVISIECSRSKMELLSAFGEFEYPNDIGPGIYDIHSPRVPGVEEMAGLLRKAMAVIPAERLWVNPDCGLKTRDWPETMASLANVVAAAKMLRAEIEAEK
ncbi:5-methyltetrahydropteroyltriglutamate--homocysteine S-methyltransferase [Desulfovibrio sulfodismutans]|uniref:5-methyltetrahydropteroyltriglutamate--homocysteine methyltransferase n=1 Tax=Desulfolutivibrio sulfodismutans TaxID=63561 RepID=A0A7K3NLU6_9BACT|nr:5-methyltetrahydropteroyltriglutamate--homocysteine S-methyltransferase [Desulfolutivibrio sulfodismutans]NDY56745.1 5-methyltetrahydropteroyltriglutamate--homocysteine S-methyltransferase [Desulfolutivibrio sulfodismutans]QLA14015.1 5-methyltetrahydropteroyltriglutamate--homocysteine S-methyltransferase [Desulfolutivibrio sulfodismutans DSM 3696]